jgi:hypothetical protein
MPLFDDTDANDQVMKAEVLRHLGEFELARQELGHISSPQYAMVVRQLRMLCDAEDNCVRELILDR